MESYQSIGSARLEEMKKANLVIKAMRVAGSIVFMISTRAGCLVVWVYSLFGLYLILGCLLLSGVMKLARVGPLNGKYLDAPSQVTISPSNIPTANIPTANIPTTNLPTFKFPNARLLNVQHTGTSANIRILVNEGTPDQAVKYINVNRKVNALANRVFFREATIELPYLPAGDWTSAAISLAPNSRIPAVIEMTCDRLLGVQNSWHHTSFEYFDLNTYAMEGAKDNVMLVSHPSLNTSKKLAVMKYAIFPGDIPSIEKETTIYQGLVGFSAAPRFLGHVTEHGRVIGFLLEYIESARTASHANDFTDLALERCRQAMADLHSQGVVHNNAYPNNCLIRPSGEAVWIDFELAENTAAKGDSELGRDYNLLKINYA
ncbi:hypothetical protein GGS21DRAFT_523925 [Xylaria nigripes]|nr:hypothetical protein GGS21DRAFT_523925 [Xylaria nigripes]